MQHRGRELTVDGEHVDEADPLELGRGSSEPAEHAARDLDPVGDLGGEVRTLDRLGVPFFMRCDTARAGGGEQGWDPGPERLGYGSRRPGHPREAVSCAGVDDAVIAVICAGLCVTGIFLIVFAPWRRVRDEPRLRSDVESRLLLGENPDDIAADSDAEEADALAHRPDPPVDLQPRIDAS